MVVIKLVTVSEQIYLYHPVSFEHVIFPYKDIRNIHTITGNVLGNVQVEPTVRRCIIVNCDRVLISFTPSVIIAIVPRVVFFNMNQF